MVLTTIDTSPNNLMKDLKFINALKNVSLKTKFLAIKNFLQSFLIITPVKINS
jgi:hypothetical protein